MHSNVLAKEGLVSGNERIQKKKMRELLKIKNEGKNSKSKTVLSYK